MKEIEKKKWNTITATSVMKSASSLFSNSIIS